MKLTHHAKTGYDQESVILPQAEVGMCQNHQRCKNFLTDLANGYCVECWDRGLDNRTRGSRRKREKIQEPTIRKSRKTSIVIGRNVWRM